MVTLIVEISSTKYSEETQEVLSVIKCALAALCILMKAPWRRKIEIHSSSSATLREENSRDSFNCQMCPCCSIFSRKSRKIKKPNSLIPIM